MGVADDSAIAGTRTMAGPLVAVMASLQMMEIATTAVIPFETSTGICLVGTA